VNSDDESTASKSDQNSLNTTGVIQKIENLENESEDEEDENSEQTHLENLEIPFEWGNKGSVEIRSIKYIIQYDPSVKGFKQKKSDSNFLISELSWEKKKISDIYPEKVKVGDPDNKELYKFSLVDKQKVNIDSGKVQILKLPKLEFIVNIKGKFLKALNTKVIAQDLIMKKRKEMLLS
jgi:hypothetical protein